MSGPKLMLLDLDQIEVAERLRDVDEAQVVKLQTSMAERGLIAPLSVRIIESNRYRLMAGAHRYQAARNLFAKGLKDWGKIACLVENCSAEEAELREIDENLHRAELTPYDQAEFLAKRWLIWNRIYGSGHGGDRKGSSWEILNLIEASKKKGFFAATSQVLGIDEWTIRQAVKRRVKMDDESWSRIRGTDAAKKGVLLDRLLKQKDRLKILDAAEAEFGGSIERALNSKAPAEKKVPSVAKVLKAVDAGLAAWKPEQKLEFFQEMKARK